MNEPAEIKGLSARAAKSVAWIVAARVIMRVLGFVNTIVLARLLAPEDFGLFAVALTAMQLLQGLSDIGVSQAVIRFRDAGRGDLDTLFTLSAIRGAATSVLLFAAAPMAAEFYGDPRMFWVFAGVAAFPFITGLSNPSFFEFERNYDFSKEFVSTATTKLVGVVVSIVVAVVYGTYWAIILGLLAGGVVQLALSYVMRPYLPRLTFRSLRKVLDFSGWLAGVSFMAALNNKLDAFILARAIGPVGTGNYYVGQQLAELPTTEIASPIARAIYPGLSAMQANVERMRLAYLKGVEMLGAIAMPASIGFSFVARDLISLLLGEKWLAAAPVVEILTPVMGLQTLFVATQYYAMALGLTRLVFFRELMFFMIRFPVFVWAAFAFGLEGAIYAVAGCGLIHVAFNLVLYSRASGRPLFEPLWSARRSIVSVAIMAAVLFIVKPWFGLIDGAPLAAGLTADIVTGAGVYLATHFVLWRLEGRPDGAEKTAITAAKGQLARFAR